MDHGRSGSFFEYSGKVQILSTDLCDVKLLRIERFADERGWFAEIYNRETFQTAGLPTQFSQDNQSRSRRGVLRGLHYQLGKPQGKLIRCLNGHIWDVAVDLRRNSPDFGRWVGFHLHPVSSEGALEMLWIPEGFAHGVLVLSESAEVLYKTTDLYYPAGERCILWNDPTLNIEWPLAELAGIRLSMSPRDVQGRSFLEAELPPIR